MAERSWPLRSNFIEITGDRSDKAHSAFVSSCCQFRGKTQTRRVVSRESKMRAAAPFEPGTLRASASRTTQLTSLRVKLRFRKPLTAVSGRSTSIF